MSLTNTRSSSRKSSAKKSRTSAQTALPPGFTRVKKLGNCTEYLFSKNGLRVLIAQISGSPTVTTNIVYRVGSQHERTGETGLAHMLEHMLFKPTTGKGVKWKDLENKGANLNATTWLDRTLYYFNMPHEYLSDMLAVEADRMRNVRLTDKEFAPERANVLSEYEMYNSRPENALEWRLTAAAFERHGYHHDTIGFRGDIESYTTETLRSFYDTHYWPQNATLIIAGDVDEHSALTLVKKHFGSIAKKQGGDAAVLARTEAAQEGVRRVSLVRPTPLRLILMAFKAPAFSSKDWVALELALLHLTDGETSPLYKALVEAGHGTSVDAHLYPTKDPYLATFQIFATEKADYAHIERIVLDAIDALTKKTIPAKTLALLKESVLSETTLARDGSMKVASELAEYVATGDWTRYETSMSEIRAITPADIQRVVKEYLTLRKATIGTLHADDTTL